MAPIALRTGTPRRLGAWAALAAVALLLSACASGPRISSEADPEADFGGYRSFAFHSPLAVESQGYSTPTSRRIRDAARAQMEARGYVYDTASPDLWVNLNAYLQERTDVTTMPEVDYDFYYSYRARSYLAVPYWRDRTDVRRYTEGTLNVDLVDARHRRLVWTGVAVGRVGRVAPEQRGARIDAAMAEIFARYPYRAGAR
ncbi:hypothetical protein B1992_04725 [Pseudoxanthomonas broegbernensis]|uniref:DUF4136 domain-containing protein n=1 Tax=Pseudoxanthomonas broegbernensis TaxID=83619 RepID=A0A7V8GNX6_9GAMM|nr:DUF4136 domain-containing protein [Pseudoxanthomonas broegbernensis]KAF1687287.1 hypothetical protein B1992_04725 [Pseudoxanthomonas broegbernensis]MBB6065717.1 hypothetical protein [Pseudoxanthomonas broegbernensis]